jgi:hypothetical protein
MKLHLLMYIVNIAQDLRHFLRNYTLNNRTKFIFYSSDIVEKISLSVEMIMEMVYGKTKEVDLFTRKKFLLLLLEFVRAGFKFRELKSLSNLGYDFYIEKGIYLQNILEMGEEEYERKLETVKYI